ncbi:hypothetical protein EJB05_33404, partial [Eragrostis curvula]
MAPQVAILVVAALLVAATAPSAHGQASSAPSPAPAPAKSITAVLTKAGQFTKFIQLLQSTQEADQINNQLKSKSFTGGFTVFAPPDNAFAALPAGTLNSLSDQQKTSLVQFHVVSQILPAAQLDTVSNPLRTQAGDVGRGKYPLNVTSDGGQQVNVSTGVVNATVDSTVYAGDRLVVYQVSKVLLPWALYGPPVPAPAPAPVESRKKKKKAGTAEAVADAPVADTAEGTTASAAARGVVGDGFGVAAVIMAAIWLGM